MSAQSEISEKQRNINPNSLLNLRKFQEGQSGNPGGVKKGTVFVSECYKRLMAMSLPELHAFQPSNAAEAAALRQVATAIYGYEALPSLKEITDRTEGKPEQHRTVDRRTVEVKIDIAVAESVEAARKLGLSIDSERAARLLELIAGAREEAE